MRLDTVALTIAGRITERSYALSGRTPNRGLLRGGSRASLGYGAASINGQTDDYFVPNGETAALTCLTDWAANIIGIRS